MNACQRIRERLADNGPAALQKDSLAQEHLVECEHCFRFLENLDRLDLELGSLPVVDAPDELVARLLDREELTDPAAPEDSETRWFLKPLFQGWNPRRARALVWGAGALVSASLLFVLFIPRQPSYKRPVGGDGFSDGLLSEVSSKEESDEMTPEQIAALNSLGYTPDSSEIVDELKDRLDRNKGGIDTQAEPRHRPGPRRAPPPTPRSVPMKKKLPQERVTVIAEGPVVALEDTQATTKFSEEFVQDLPVPGRKYQNVVTLAPGVTDADGDGNPNVHGSRDRDFKTSVGGVSSVDPLTGQQMSQINPNSIEEMETITAGAGAEFSRAQGGFANIDTMPASTAADFLAERSNVEPGAFQEATGYWSNTYLPGDPMLRYLRARLRQPVAGLEWLAIHSSAQATEQPFDAPQHAAIALQLQADRRATEGPARTLVQVGIKAVEHLGGRRPAMNLAIVIDAGGETPDDVATGVRAIVDALNGARRTGDRFRLLVANDRGGVAIDADRFRHGQLRVALARLFSSDETLDGPRWELREAVNQAIGLVAEDEDPKATLGASAVLVVTGRPLKTNVEDLEALVHRSAIAGIPVSVLAVGTGADPEQLERLTIAGQGRLGALLRPADAESLIDRELTAVSRAVARAVRLRIRLAPGVQLVDVIGSHRLGATAAERVRQSEQSLDLRLARNLGITADRGEDEDGIQIVIPNFYASDEHVILLDLVTPGTGPLIDVTARFKDLVQMENGTVRASLRLDRGNDARGPREINVLKNYLAQRLSETLKAAGAALARGDSEIATTRLRTHRQLLVDLPALIPGLKSDSEIERDRSLILNYLAALDRPGITPAQQAWLADSMRYASSARLLLPDRIERNQR